MTTKGLKIENLQDLNIRELTEEETASLQGGMLAADYLFPPDRYPKPDKPINNFPCTNHPTKDGHLPWCAVIL